MSERVRNTWKNKPSVIFLVIIFILLVFLLLFALLYRSGIFSGGFGGDGQSPNTELVSPTADLAEVEPEPTTTPTPTLVVQEGDETGSEEEATATPTPAAADQPPTPSPTPAEADTDLTITPTPAAPRIAELLRNGGFEQGMDQEGVGLNWQSFNNGAARYIFTNEGWRPGIRNGDYAQRISILETNQADRYAGIYQTVNVVPGATYLLALQGQIRSGLGDVQASNYGYRMQVAIDETGNTDWQAVPNDVWIELPWDEQLIDGSNLDYYKYETTFRPATRQVTIFIRAWAKWPFQGEAQFSLDSLSLIGPAP
jgi:hypothetical protein